ncbi:hypothetical protein [Citreimonas sp.]
MALVVRGIPSGPALFEVMGIAGVFFGGTALWALRELRRAPRDDDAGR